MTRYLRGAKLPRKVNYFPTRRNLRGSLPCIPSLGGLEWHSLSTLSYNTLRNWWSSVKPQGIVWKELGIAGLPSWMTPRALFRYSRMWMVPLGVVQCSFPTGPISSSLSQDSYEGLSQANCFDNLGELYGLSINCLGKLFSRYPSPA